MSIVHSLCLAALQGISEFLPISSFGHLVLLQHAFGIRHPQVVFDITLHVGTLFSVLIFFRREIGELFRSRKQWLGLIAIGTVPTAAVGIAGSALVERLSTEPLLVAAFLIVNGAWLIAAGFLSARRKFEKGRISRRDSVLIGFVQGIATLPGISRSGATISTALMLGIERKESARFSFLLSVPAILGAFVLKGAGGGREALSGIGVVPLLLGVAVSCVVGLVSLKFLFRVLEKSGWHWFGIYCAGLGLLLIALQGRWNVL